MTSFGVTKDQIFKACENLIKKEINITVANVREYLGTGSYSTLTPVIKDFKNRLKATVRKPGEAPPLPFHLEKKFNSIINEVWIEMSKYFLEEMSLMKKEYSKKLNEVEKRLEDKNEEYDQMLKDLQEYEAKLESLSRQTNNNKKAKK
jgi:hypothetical protein